MLMVTNTAMLVYRPRRQEEGLSNTMNTFCLHRGYHPHKSHTSSASWYRCRGALTRMYRAVEAAAQGASFLCPHCHCPRGFPQHATPGWRCTLADSTSAGPVDRARVRQGSNTATHARSNNTQVHPP